MMQVLVGLTNADVSTYQRPAGQQRMIQHKNEAYFFYMFLSQVYDYIVNPGHWTVDMRDEALEPALLNDRNLKVRMQHTFYSRCNI